VENILRVVSKFWRIKEDEIYALREIGMTLKGSVRCPLTLACALAFGLDSMRLNFAIVQRSRPDLTTFFLRTLRFSSLVKTDSQLTTYGRGTVLRDRTKTALEPTKAHYYSHSV